MLTYLTGKSYSDWDVVMNDEEKSIPAEAAYATVSKDINNSSGPDNTLIVCNYWCCWIGFINWFQATRLTCGLSCKSFDKETKTPVI